MTIAEMQLSRMRPLLIDRHSLEGLRHARRRRRISFGLLVATWSGIWIYGIVQLFSGADLAATLDRFLPLQVVAALAALAVILHTRGLRRTGLIRRAALAPALVTALGAGGLVLTLGADGLLPADHAARPDSGPILRIQSISL